MAAPAMATGPSPLSKGKGKTEVGATPTVEAGKHGVGTALLPSPSPSSLTLAVGFRLILGERILAPRVGKPCASALAAATSSGLAWSFA